MPMSYVCSLEFEVRSEMGVFSHNTNNTSGTYLRC